MAKTGRPTKYSQQLVDRICEQIVDGKSLRSICRDEGMPNASSVFKWLSERQDFSEQYARACQARAEAMAEDILEISDDNKNDWEYRTVNGRKTLVPNNEVVNRSKLRVDTRKWLMSKVQPKKYADHLDLTTQGDKLPTPILANIPNGVPSNNSTQQDTSAQ